MAMRPRGGAAAAPRRGARPGGVRAVYEDFRPVSEWKQDDETHILNVYLTGFTKEQIRVSTEGRNNLRVRGERLVAGNKWSRFLEDFQVPDDGEMNLVRAKFQGGILNITVPIKHVDKPQETPAPKPKGNDVQNSPTTGMKDQDKPLPEVSTSQPADERSTQQQNTSAGPSIKKSRQDEKSLESQKALDDDNKRAHDQKGDQQRDASATPIRNTGVAVSRDAGKETSESKDKNIASDSKMVDRERKKNDNVGTKELPEGEAPFGREGIPEMNMKADRKALHGDITKKKYKKAVEGLAELNEERQLLVNMGAAMLVIVALTAYVTYTFASGKDKN